ncbi:peptide/nickel transport system permease protein [Halanaerobium congolense]|uniref:Peptide/nickel transport system permease protein n=1 Tax=Halanaerobium congolense TaxID=54121 RepID=A0A1H9Z216_9FIRM|nr:ABC transporter permease [Halanaerobium congolense]PTX17574.1 peptide/nickel transport system permease protein [Halanaerobium congolense]SDE95428.1 peptide/nickel transport system permease protein [Halanaerobium congolense]SES75523.1 peptide/nickel transport system permease protein [Halanaerobium congolense]SFP07260.1 peptide/nickel transport system permease protein [Halanaerobium congolense]
MQHKLKLDDQIKVNSGKTLWQKKLARLFKNKFALTAALIIFILYFLAIFAPFFAPYSATKNFKNKFFHPPTEIHFTDENGLTLPYIYGTEVKEGWAEYEINKEQKYPIKFWKQGDSYQLLGVFESNIHLFGVEADQPIFILGSDNYGRDLFTRILYGGRVSLFIGFIAIFITTFIGLIMGGISGYYGGFIDSVIMRAVEVIMSIPSFYLLLALAAVLPLDLSSAFRFFLIVSILAFQGWAGMARVIRGMVLSVKSEDYIAAAKALGANDKRIILKHILPSTATYVIIRATIAIPGYIIMESGLSFIGLGIQEPSASWGNMLSAAQNITKISDFPWLLLPGLFIFITVLSYNILGDGLRDALDPKS